MILFGLLLCLAAAPAGAEDPYVVAPVQGAQDLRLLPASAWHPGDADQNEMLLKFSYLRGVLDALQYVQLAPKSSTQALTQLKGLSLGELAASLDQYYLADPNRKDPPIAVLLRILPEAAAQAARKAGEAAAPTPAPPEGGKPAAQPAPPATSPGGEPQGVPATAR